MNVKPLSSKFKVGFVALVVLLSSLGLASPAHAKTYKCSKGGSFKVSKGILNYGQSCKGNAKIPASVTMIGVGTEYAGFAWAKGLTSVTFAKGNNLKAIGAFSGTAITKIEIPASVTVIDESSFEYVSKLKSVTFAKGSKLNSIGYAAFSDTAITSITIPASVKRIDNFAFSETPKLKTVTFAKGSKLKTIGTFTFHASAITSITIPASVTSIGEYAFSNTKKLKSVGFAKGSKLVSIGFATFSDSMITSITIPAAVTSIGAWAFNHSKVQNISVLPGNAHYSSIDGVVFNKNVTRLIIFPPKKVLNTYTLPESVTSISNYAFAYSGVKRIEVAEENQLLSSIEGVVFDKDATKLIAFPPKMDIRPYTIPSSVTVIGDGAFAGGGLTAITIPYAVTHIGSYAFSGNLLSSIEFPSSLTSMGDYAFYGNPLRKIVFNGNCPDNYSQALQGISLPENGGISYTCTRPF